MTRTTEAALTTLQRIEDWYRSQCGEWWEHSFGIKIETIDNPGWSVEIDLTDTQLQNVNFRQEADNGESDWFSIEVKNGTYRGVGDPNKLELILITFLEEVVDR